jgi:hypothetical protein
MSKTRLYLVLSILNLLGFLGTVIVNGLANALPINNRTTGELSDLYPNLFVPVGLTFSIWGVIYILLAIFVIYELFVAARKDSSDSSFIGKINILFFVSCLANIGWIFAWHYEIVALSLVLMLILLGTLISIYLRLRIGISNATSVEKYLVHLPFSVYLGWITIATIANVTALLVNIGLTDLRPGEQFWAVVVIVVGIAITLAMLFRRSDIYYSLVVDWAFVGILLKRLTTEAVVVQSVVITVIIGLVLISLGILTQVVRKKVY